MKTKVMKVDNDNESHSMKSNTREANLQVQHVALFADCMYTYGQLSPQKATCVD